MNGSSSDAKDRNEVQFYRDDSMWRSFFYALSVGLMVLGGEALIFERVSINPDAKLPRFAGSIFQQNGVAPNSPLRGEDQYAFGGPQQFGLGGPNVTAPIAGQPVRAFPASANAGTGYSVQSRFGPSRFAGPANGGYGGGRIGFDQNPQLGRSTPSTGQTTQAQLASLTTPVGAGFGGQLVDGRRTITGPKKEIITKDWMPWSLIAVGAIVFLYTHTSRRRYSD